MKRITGLLMMTVSISLLVSCGSVGGFSASSKEDKDLFKAIRAVEKSNHADARKDLPLLYEDAVQRREAAIASYRNSNSPSRWQNIISELEALQSIYGAISSSQKASKLVTVKSYDAQIREAREKGAEEFYELGQQYLQYDDRQNARKAYDAFQAANRLHSNYKNTASLMREARDRAVLDIVINPVQANGYMYSNWNFRSENIQRELVRDLGGSFGNNLTGARFYTEYEARSQRVQPDWIVDLGWQNLYISPSRQHNYSRQVSRNIQVGTDTSGKPVFRNVTATLYITEQTINARGDMEYRVTDLASRDDVEWSRIPAYLDLNIQQATYRGDSRALSEYDWALVNSSRRSNYLNEGEIMDEMYRRIYPQLRNRIESLAR